jgi:hypothetical protein
VHRPDHQHRQAEVHRHRSAVSLPEGTKITAVSFDAADPYARDRQPGYGLYLDRRWQPPWDHDHLGWPDFGVPADLPPRRTPWAGIPSAMAGHLAQSRRRTGG